MIEDMPAGRWLQRTGWTTNARDAELHLTQQAAGNGVASSQGFDVAMPRCGSLSRPPVLSLSKGRRHQP
jgi:hypothetical protein